ncbi:MAG: DUF1648 domain-containing protein [Micrococcales bacterium]|nr:DUF1648 domain-containing protein [Micrococcales bacterium]
MKTDHTLAIESYLRAVSTNLTALSARDRHAVMTDLASLLREDAARVGPDAAIAALGSPADYATGIFDAWSLDGPVDAQPQGHIGPVPVDLRGPSVARLTARFFDPSDPHVFTPRLFGAGWGINLGAVAVRLRLLRPDDVDAAVLAAVPRGATVATLAVPAAVAASVLATLCTRAGDLPDRLPTHWDIAGEPNAFAAKRLVLACLAALVSVPLVPAVDAAARRAPVEEQLVWNAQALLWSGLGASLAGVTMTNARGGRHGNLVLLGLAVSGAAALVSLAAPIRAGVHRVATG